MLERVVEGERRCGARRSRGRGGNAGHTRRPSSGPPERPTPPPVPPAAGAPSGADTLEVKVYVNNCLMLTNQSTQTGPVYFKNGTYGCQATMCRANFKNITLWKK
jgi:hypothetical protein